MCASARQDSTLRRSWLNGLVVLSFSCASAFADERLAPITLVEGDDIAFSRAENAEEFSQSRVAQIAQDDKGFMWFGTQYGLHRFDGYGYTVFAHDSRSQQGLSGVFVYALRKDRSGRLWVASDQGLDVFDPASATFSRVDLAGATKMSMEIQFIHEDRSGTIWLCTTEGLYALDSRGRVQARFQHDAKDPASLGSSDVKFAMEDRDGKFWVTNGSGLESIDRTTGHVLVRVPLRETREMGVVEDRQGILWIYHASGSGLSSFDQATGLLTNYQFGDATGRPLPRFGIFTSLVDRDGRIWFGTGGAGLLRFDLEHHRFIRYRNNTSDRQSLGGDDVASLFQDDHGNIWVGMHGLPLNLFAARSPSFRKLPSRPDTTRGRTEKMVNTILDIEGKSLWISFVGQLLGVDLGTGRREDLSARLRLDSDVISMARDARGRVWLGTTHSGLMRVDPDGRTARFQHEPGDESSLASDVVNDILVDHAQNIWLATWGGLSRFDERRGTFENFLPPGMNPKYLALAENADHQLWLATHLDGLQRFDPATGKFVLYPANSARGGLSNGRVNAVHVDRGGIVWAGTQNGLDALDPATGEVRSYHSEDGLPGNAVSCILEDSHGAIWMSTNNGIGRLDARTGEFRNYSRADGLPGMDFTGWGGCDQSKAGEMLFAGFAGATAFDPEHVGVQSYLPRVEFTDLMIAGRPYPGRPEGSRSQVLPDFGELTLPYSQNTFTAGFAALSYTNPASSRYRFRLVGLEEQWHSVRSDRRIASYNSLQPGNYRLEVQGATSAGPWSATKRLDLTILKPWWQTLQFRMAIGLALFGLAWLAYRIRVQQVKHQFEIRLDERVAERTRIARELHDSLLQGFHGLIFRLQAVRNLLPVRPLDAAQALDEALERGDETVEQARLAVTDLRSTGPRAPDLETALNAMAHDLPMLSRAGAPECRVAVEGARRPLIPLVRDDVLQVAREALRNAVLHAHARQVRVEAVWGEHRFSLRVRDDGVGLDPELIAHGRDGHWGLHGMRERTRQVGGSLEIRSDRSSGTVVELSIPAARAYAKTP